MKFSARLTLFAIVPACLFIAAVGTGLWGLVSTRASFDHYLATEQKVANGLAEMYAQGLQMGQALRNIVMDPANAKAYENLDAARKDYDAAYQDTLNAAVGSEEKAKLQTLVGLREAHATAQAKVLELAKSDASTAMRTLNSDETPAWRKLRSAILEQRKNAQASSAAAHEQTQAASQRVTLIAIALSLVALLASAVFTIISKRTVRYELGGEPDEARAGLRRVASGVLSGEIHGRQGLMGELAAMQESLRRLVGQMRTSIDSISTASTEIASGNLDLSSRTEQAASSLEQTAASLEELTSTVRQTADAAHKATDLAASAQGSATKGGEVFGRVVSTMSAINTSSKKISDIIGVIDSIAFQTNILALNAAVEAARAGDQGRGFAVVASEVRGLAQRSAVAAKEIAALIGTSAEHADAGAKLVTDAGNRIEDIVASVQRVSEVIGEIASVADEERDGIVQINAAVTNLDQLTQQNSALVEQSAAAAESLKEQAQRLSALVSEFRM